MASRNRTAMMKPFKKTGSLTFIKMVEPRVTAKSVKPRALFRCDCGDVKEYYYYTVKYRKDMKCMSCAIKSRAKKRTVHGKRDHRLYRKWRDMKRRCHNPSSDVYEYYGGAGIVVCEEWRYRFKPFYDWAIANGWKKGLEIDRIDVTGNYEPNNCRFLTHKEQGWNKSNTVYVKINGKEISLAELMYKNDKSHKYKGVYMGLRKGKSIEYYIEKLDLTVDM